MWGVVRQHVAGRSASAPALGAAGPGPGPGPAERHHSAGLQLGLHPAGKPEACTLRCARARLGEAGQVCASGLRGCSTQLESFCPRPVATHLQPAFSLASAGFDVGFLRFGSMLCAPARVCRRPAAARVFAQQRAAAVG